VNESTVMAALFERGVSLTLDQDELLVDAPAGTLSETDVALLREHRAGIVRLLKRMDGAAARPLVAVRREAPFELSPVQQAVLLMHELAGDTGYCNIPLAFEIRGELDASRLRRALERVVARHDILRTVYLPGEPARQRVLPAIAVPWQERGVAADETPGEVLAGFMRARFDLTRDAPVQACLLRVAPAHHVFGLLFHQIALDGGGCAQFLADLGAAYDAPLAAAPFQFGDFVAWQQSLRAADGERDSLDYWRRTLRGAPPLHGLPTDFVRPAVQTYAGNTLDLPLAADDFARLESFARELRSSPFVVLQAAFALLVSRYGEIDDVVIGTAVANRARPELQGVLGNLVNTLVYRFDVAAAGSFAALVRQADAHINEAALHQHVPFGALLDAVQPPRSSAYNPLVQLMLVMQDEAQTALTLPGLDLEPVFVDPGIAKFDLALHVYRRAGGAVLRFEYATALFRAATIATFAAHFTELLTRVLAQPEAPLATLQLAVQTPPAAQVSREARRIEAWIADQSRRTPTANAVCHADEALSYANLEAAADNLAARLRGFDRDASQPFRVGVCVDKSPALVTAMLAIWKAGGVYVPLDPDYPAARLEFMMRDAALAVLLVAGPHPDAGAIPLLDLRASEVSPSTSTAPGPATRAKSVDDIAYVIFTSGSTGKPKGVEVPHSALWHSLHSNLAVTGFEAGDVMPCIGSQAFGVSLLEMLLPLTSGGATRTLPRATSRDIDALIAATQDASVLHAVPSLMHRWLERLEERPSANYPRLRLLLVGGESVPDDLLRRLRAWRPGIGLVELYGMTESAVVCSSYRPGADYLAHCCIGRPHPTAQFHVLNRAGAPQPAGVPGELYIGGPQLARGYLNLPDMTAERFVPNGFADGRLYRTGDRVRRLAGGEFEFLGRVDNQVSLRGVRIECGEIEALLVTHAAVAKAVAHVVALANGEPTLVAYYTTRIAVLDEAAFAVELRELLAKYLPDYMRPAVFQRLESLPLNPNGKVDRRALPIPKRAAGEARAATALEADLLPLWRSALGLPEAGVEDDFFALGGNSLLATKLVNQVKTRHAIELAVTALFDAPTVRALARLVERARERADIAQLAYVVSAAPAADELVL
jgi:amino acid adenylation domain-containing protein